MIRTFLIKICLDLNKNLCNIYTGEFKEMLVETSVQLNKEKSPDLKFSIHSLIQGR